MLETDWQKAFIELVGYVDRYTNDGKNRWYYDGNVWKSRNDPRPRKTDMMSEVMLAELAKGEWKRKC